MDPDNIVPLRPSLTPDDGLPEMTDEQHLQALTASDSPTSEQPDPLQMLSAKVATLTFQNMQLIGGFNGLVEKFNAIATRHNQMEEALLKMGVDLARLVSQYQNGIRTLDRRLEKAIRNGAQVLYLPDGGIRAVGGMEEVVGE